MHNPVVASLLNSSYPRRGWNWGWLGLAGLISAAWASGAATESLWLDELHSSWTVADGLSEVTERARAGNQSPLFFWFLFALMGTLGSFSGFPQEWLLRLPAIVGFAAVVVLCLWEAWKEGSEKGGGRAVLVAIFAWLLLDRVQLFYATEARVYSAVQLVSLLAWLAVWRMRTAKYSVWVWSALSVTLVFLHVTAVLAVAAQILWGTWLVYRELPDQRRRWAGGVGVVLMASTAALLLSARVWAHREQWNSFAGEASLLSFIGLLPLLAYGVPVGLCRWLDWIARGRRQWNDEEVSGGAAAWYATAWEYVLSMRGLWWLATLGPWIAAWCITALGVAPVFHRRFVIVSAVPLIMLAAVEVGCIRRPSLRWSAVLGVAAWLIVSQGTLDNWRAGYWYGWQRWEGWRQAATVLSEQVQPGDQLWCASGLVEATGAALPLDDPLNRYLSFPLRGAYRVIDASGSIVEPRGLLVSSRDWAEQLSAAREMYLGSQASRPERGSDVSTMWIVYRGSSAGFNQRLAAMHRRLTAETEVRWRIDPPQAFGLVNIARVTSLRDE